MSSDSAPAPVRLGLAVPVLLGLMLSACGRVGALEPPPSAAAAAKPPPPSASGLTVENMGTQVKPKVPPVTPPNQPFFLDFLLK